MYERIIELGLVKLAIVSVAGLLWGIYEAAKKPIDSGWTPIVKEPIYDRAWRRLTGRRGSTSFEVRK